MTTPEIPDVAVWAAAEAMYIQRPANTDPKHWETPWADVPEGWKQGQYWAARQVLEAAMPHLQPTPRTVTSIEELRALPPDTIVRDKRGVLFELGDDPDDSVLWVLATADYWRKGDDVLMDNGPFNVLYEPEEAAVKVVYAPPPSRYVVQLRSVDTNREGLTDWEDDRGFQSLHDAKERADKCARLFPNLQVRVVTASE